ncbi:FkbM family methyltransferase [Limnoraphis robusta]|uniref:FkbM family methyltransferase n=1 Tax=Limnoraphis robusta CCNP1315 TaxID=3110306 RepID=A0ABU5TTB0_9CYAN|nr:FkbM family methyltransferase [Limnoraphis robusta]MEA5518137.1 FkbM family methyltransferase [Limnoraphis robusta CCNP1315]MEA5543419.1 FkbM family methyltransferase [Limnoraphis robusta CCNP1324]
MSVSDSSLNKIIPPEIKNDAFYQAIQKIAAQESVKNILEIGSSSGGGSTEAFVRGIKDNPSQPTLFCMEVSKPRFAELQKAYSKESFVKCYNVSSVSIDKFPSQEDVIKFYQNNRTNLNSYPIDLVLSWLEQDIEYVNQSGVEADGIRKIKEENNIKFFDVVLIDGSEFTGISELEEVYGAKYILLDDINTFKNYSNYHKLMSDYKYELLEQDSFLRNGYAIFKRKTYSFSTEVTEQLLVKNLIRSGMTVFDIGANVGDYTLLFSELVEQAGRVYVFEPTYSTYNKLTERVQQQKCENVEIYQNAIFSENIEIEFNEFAEEYSVWNSIGKPQMLNPDNALEYVPIVKTERVDAITLDSFCQQHDIKTIDYLKIDVEGAESDALLGALGLLREKAVRFIQFEISQKMLEGLSRKAQDTFDILIQNGYECHRITPDGKIGEEVRDSDSFYENYIAFPQLPIHFFTIVLNGEPFIRYHIDVFKQLSCKWHWHIIEGVADLKHDTAWSLQNGGLVTDEIHQNGLSKDGTSEYIDEIAKLYPENITVYRKPEGVFWDGKREMVNAPLPNIQEECLLWQVDVDELWTVEQINTARQLFITHPEKTAAFYWCWYFVGEDLVISTRNCYAQNPQQDWLRTWRFKPGAFWAAHEPPILVEPLAEGQQQNVAAVNPFLHAETEKQGLIFQHFAYVTPEQLKFKEQYYGYTNAVNLWNTLQSETNFPVYLRQYFPWVQDQTMVDKAKSRGITPIAQKDKAANWKFIQPDSAIDFKAERKLPTIVVDGVFFQLYKTGIARVWRSLLEEWAKNGFSQHIIVLDRVGTAPKIPGIFYRTIPAYDYNQTDSDRAMLQQVCDEEGADLFISTYYTTPISTPSVFMAYDMIPEVLGADFNEPMWREKHNGIRHASAYISISENTASDLVKCFSGISPEQVTIAHCGVSNSFTPATQAEIQQFKIKYGISKPYFILVGAGSNYKNAGLFFQAFDQLHSKQGFEIVCTGGSSLWLSAEYRQFTSGCVVHPLQLSDEELSIAYSGATALVYPSLYEGFGMPVAEAMACGCPVITCYNSSIPEVAGEAAIYVNERDINAMANALCDVQKPEVRRQLIETGLQQVQKFTWSKMAEKVSSALINATLQHLKLGEHNFIIFPDWSQSEELLSVELGEVIKAVLTHPQSDQITLLIDNSNISGEEADLALSSIMMNLMMEEELEIADEPNISLIGQLSEIQWSALIPHLKGRIILEHENQEAIQKTNTENLPTVELDSLR